MGSCSYDGCEKPVKTYGLCAAHYTQQRRGQELRPTRASRGAYRNCKCDFDTCERPASSFGLCKAHYRQKRKGKELTPIIETAAPGTWKGVKCEFSECERYAKTAGLCSAHYQQRMRGSELTEINTDRVPYGSNKGVKCSYSVCDREVSARGLCARHYWQRRSGNDLKPIRPPGKSDKPWVRRDGYVERYDPDHPNANALGVIKEHRWVMSNHLGRPLIDGENVHHINGDRSDNRIENLELWTSSQPAGQRVTDLLNWAREILNRYDGLSVS